MPEFIPVRLIQSVAKEQGIKLSSRMAIKASHAMDAEEQRTEDRAAMITTIQDYIRRTWGDPTGETAVRNIMNPATA